MQRLPLFVILCITAGLCAWNIGRRAPGAFGVRAGDDGGFVHAASVALLESTSPEPMTAAEARSGDSLPAESQSGLSDDLTQPAETGLELSEELSGESESEATEEALQAYQDQYESPEGTVRVEGFLLNGVLEGPCTEYSLQGEKLAEGTYFEGARAGRWVFWRPDGIKRAEGHYLDGHKDGNWLSWHDDGSPERQANYQAGEPHGPYIEWYTNGEIRSQGMFIHGLREGEWIFRDYFGASDPRSGFYANGKRLR